MTLKETIAAYLDDTNRETGEWVTGAISFLIFLSVVIFVFETYEISEQVGWVLRGVDWAILSFFTLEYVLRLWTAERWWGYLFSPYGLVDLVAIFPFVVGFLDMRFVRLLRWLRILRLVRFLGDRAFIGQFTAADTLAVVRIVFTVFAIIFIYAGIIFQVEQDTFSSFLDAAYFAVVTMTTVGYGDITPVSEVGRLCTILMILTGIALIPTQLGNLIRQVVKVSQSQQVPCSACGWSIHDADAAFCKRCGTALVMEESDRSTDNSLTKLAPPPPMPFAPRSIAEISPVAWPQSEESSKTLGKETE